MTLPRHHSVRKEWAQYLLLGIPTTALMAFGIYLANQWLNVLQGQWIWQTAAFATGLAGAIGCFARRLRFVALTVGVLLLFWAMYKVSAVLLAVEFDAFFFRTKANNFVTLFAAGWIAGYGFSRSRFLTIFWAVLVLAVLMMVIASISNPTRGAILTAVLPVMAYAGYIIYTGEFLRNMNEDQTNFNWFLIRRTGSFGLLIALVLWGASQLLKPDFENLEKVWDPGNSTRPQSEKQNTLTRQDGMGTTLQPTMGIQGINNRGSKDSVLFVARLDHYFEDGETPNPLYFVSDYYTLFDTTTQSFAVDSLRPFNDLFRPDLPSIPLYQSLQDTSVLRNSTATVGTQVITAEVYKTNLSPRHFTAPATAFFVQPISVPADNKSIYKSAYRVQMKVSRYNSAYFVYNPADDPLLLLFQEERFAALRTVQDYQNAPAALMDYYTKMPAGNAYDSIRGLARMLADSAKTPAPVDKIIAIRDYFLSKDSSGNPLFRYTDNPGIPGIPGANRLNYFLFDSRKGYCAHYAGATLFLLRAMGIPSRIATGFLTVDRSNKNPGWYWFYEDQAHAWVQVWFPGYGWIDFDTTVPSTETQEAPQPDQTPPLNAQTAWMVATGIVEKTDTLRKEVTLKVAQFTYHDINISPTAPQAITLDVRLATVQKDTGQVPLYTLQPGTRITAVSFSETLKNLPPAPKENWVSLLKKLPGTIPADEIKIMDPAKESAVAPPPGTPLQLSWWQMGKWVLILLAGLIALALLFPLMLFRYFCYRARHGENVQARAYHTYIAALLYLHQLGYKRHLRTPLQMAASVTDPAFGTQLARFITLYQKMKYSAAPLQPGEAAMLTGFLPDFLKAVRSRIPLHKRIRAFLHPGETLEFFTQPNILGSSKNNNIWNSM